MKQWEYKTIYYKLGFTKTFDNKDDELNKLGQEGWECVNAYTIVSGGTVSGTAHLFKREIES